MGATELYLREIVTQAHTPNINQNSKNGVRTAWPYRGQSGRPVAKQAVPCSIRPNVLQPTHINYAPPYRLASHMTGKKNQQPFCISVSFWHRMRSNSLTWSRLKVCWDFRNYTRSSRKRQRSAKHAISGCHVHNFWRDKTRDIYA